jgi:3-deoxy-D-manno-octulosonate 8-phosphate phosphatase (KDO 8-P phosphatase)
MPEELPSFATRSVPTARWAAIKLLAIDVDGVLTDGNLTFDEEGRLYQTFYVRDGFALVAAKRAGLQIAWVSGRTSAPAQKRFEELGLDFCLLTCGDKFAALRELQEQLGVMPGECCFIGDDWPDLPAFAACGLNVAVADAVPEVLERADCITKARGGRGAVREVIEHILRSQGHWDKLFAQFTRDEFDSFDAPPPENLQR